MACADFEGEIKTDSNRCLRVDETEGDICAICGIEHIRCYHGLAQEEETPYYIYMCPECGYGSRYSNEINICAKCGHMDEKEHEQSKTELTGRRWLAENITKQCDEILSLFLYKNKDYGADADAFANFRKSAERFGTAKTEKERMIQVLMTLQDKHLVGLSHTLGTGKEDMERLLDVAVYALLARAILQS